MVDKPRKDRRAAAAQPKGQRPGGPGHHRAQPISRAAGQPVKGPARPRRVSGVDTRTMERLAAEGLLNEAGQAFLSSRKNPKGKVSQPRAKVSPTRPPARGQKLNEAEQLVAQRLQKVMAQAGVASRRHSEELIQAGRVTVNGRVVTELGTKVIPGRDIIEVDGRPLGRPEQLVYILLNKPKGYVTTLYDPQGRPKVIDLLEGEVAERVYPVGRLDYDTEGLLLLTNDGELANALMHPAKQVKKTYIAKVRGVPSNAKLRMLETGIQLEDGPTAPAEVKLVDVKPPNTATVSIRIHEGRNRQVRRMFEAIGHEVIHLRRTTLGPLHLKDLPLGAWRFLTEWEVYDLRSAAGLKAVRPKAKGALPEPGASVAAAKGRQGGKEGPGARVPRPPRRRTPGDSFPVRKKVRTK
jgi:23S rRNA pseudouridine2605 synthase